MSKKLFVKWSQFAVTKTQCDSILKDARSSVPEEACGILAGKNYVVERVIPISNKAENREKRYLMDKAEMFSAFKEMRVNGLDLVGIYHSHPFTDAYPSATDCELAFYPEAAYIIVSLKKEPVIKAFRIIGGRIEDFDFIVV